MQVMVGETSDFEELDRYIAKLEKKIKHLKPVFLAMASWWYKNNMQLLKLKGPGQYQDLAPTTKADKERKGFSVYPILKRTGRLLNSITQQGHSDTVCIISDTEMIVGTKVPYGIYHQSSLPRKKIPYRPFIFNQATVGRDNGWVKRQTDAWVRIMEQHIERSVK